MELCCWETKIIHGGRSKSVIKFIIALAKKDFLKRNNLLASNTDLIWEKGYWKLYVRYVYGTKTWKKGLPEERNID